MNYYRNKRTGQYLMHSDTYMGKDFSDGLCHWKYIKREKVNGKWRYYYDDSSNTLSQLEAKRDKIQKRNDAMFEIAYEKQKSTDMRKAVADAKYRGDQSGLENVKSVYSDAEWKKHTRSAYDSGIGNSTMRQGLKNRLEYENADKDVYYRSKSVSGKVDKFMQNNGDKIAGALNSASNSVSKGKQKVSDLLNKVSKHSTVSSGAKITTKSYQKYRNNIASKRQSKR